MEQTRATDIDDILARQKSFFHTGTTLPTQFRIEMLKKLYAAVQSNEQEIAQALYEDLGKSSYESFMCETGLALSEISHMIRHVRRYAKRHRVRTPIAQFVSVSYTQSMPYGCALIMSPWNYPFLLTIDPLADAIAAGNTAVIKPSAYSPRTSALLAKIIGETFPPEYLAVVTGGRRENASLLEKNFDFIFFTGSTGVGREVLRHAAQWLTPVVLEMGGKSPCIVDETANIPLAARRIVFGKFVNCGQTCVAPDYILCQSSVKDRLIEEIKRQITAQYGDDQLSGEGYGRIVNEKHFDRLCALIDPQKTVFGGKMNRESMQIAPTVLDNVTWEDAVMKEEIFGPVLPVLTYETPQEVIDMLAGRAKPLAMYVFSENRASIDTFLHRCQYGGGCVNDCVIHLATSEMGFGGVGESGMGAYHGKAGFDAFSHSCSIVEKKTWLDLPMRYQPYKKMFEKILHIVLR